MRYADSTTLLVENSEDLKQLLMKVKAGSAKAALQLNIKRKVMTMSLKSTIKRGNRLLELLIF